MIFLYPFASVYQFKNTKTKSDESKCGEIVYTDYHLPIPFTNCEVTRYCCCRCRRLHKFQAKMNSFNTNTHDFRTMRKCISLTGCLVFVLLMSHASCRPSETDNVPAYTDADYTDVDDIEWDKFELAETTTKDHPIIYYKEDIVSEDYDPHKEDKSSSKEQQPEIELLPRRIYKEISRQNRLNRTENYRYVYPEKVYFDVLPSKDEETKDDDTQFNDIRVEVISLTDDNSPMSSDLKRLVSKRPKKFSRRHRQRRDVTEDKTVAHTFRHKRNYRNTYYVNQLPQYRGVLQVPQAFIFKHTVKGKYTNVGAPYGHRTTSKPKVVTPKVENRLGDDETTTEEPMPIWDFQTRPSRRPPPPIIHSGDEDFVTKRPNTQRTMTTQAPRFPPAGNWNQKFDTAALGRPVFQTTTARPAPQPTRVNNREVSACIWAIISCCNAERNVRYQCFEREGCNGAFWDLNPCADDIHRNAVEASLNYFN